MRYAIIALLLTGCATVETLQTEGERTEYVSRQSPRDAAGCMARNVETYWPGIQTYVRSAGSGAEEIVVRNGPDHALVHGLVTPETQGSRAVIRSRVPVFRPELVVAMVNSC